MLSIRPEFHSSPRRVLRDGAWEQQSRSALRLSTRGRSWGDQLNCFVQRPTSLLLQPFFLSWLRDVTHHRLKDQCDRNERLGHAQLHLILPNLLLHFKETKTSNFRRTIPVSPSAPFSSSIMQVTLHFHSSVRLTDEPRSFCLLSLHNAPLPAFIFSFLWLQLFLEERNGP